MTIEDYTHKPDWNALEKGFAIHQNHFTKYWFCNSVESNEDGDYQFCFRDLAYQAKQLCGLLNGLLIEYHALKEKYEKLTGQKIKDLNGQKVPVVSDKMIPISEGLLEDLRHELVTLNKLKAFDAAGENTIVDTKISVVSRDDLIDLNLTKLIILLDIALGKPNIHKNCEYYDIERDNCRNYAMGTYAPLSYHVSRHDKCIEEIVKE